MAPGFAFLVAVGLYSVAVTAQTEEPCAAVSRAYAIQIAADPNATPTITASVAHDCLLTVPMDKKAALDLLDSIEPYLDWQSDSAYKANPPADYFYPAYNMFTNLAIVRSKVINGSYAGEYEFQYELYRTVFAPAHDGHFLLYTDLLTIPFDWNRPLSLVSISKDQSTLPEIKVYEDVISSPSTASVVTLINGIDAATYLADWVYQASWNQDADSAYNSMFYEIAGMAAGLGAGYFQGNGRIRFIYPGATTNLTFANGTEITLENYAYINAPFTNVTDGKSMYKVFCNPNGFDSGAPVAAGTDNTPASNVTIPGYPVPVIATSDAIVAGFYLDGQGYEDVAVIIALAFESASPAEFQAVTEKFFAQARADGKTKLIIDFQGNAGGYVLQGHDFFRQLFPHILQDGFSRGKNSFSSLAVAEVVSAVAADLDLYTSSDVDAVAYAECWFNYRFDLNLTDKPFLTFADKFGPVVFQDTNYTEILRWNLNDNLTTTNETYGLGIEISGYGTRTNLTQPFAAEDIILLYDGVCASTCSVASEMLRLQAGVKSVAMGGRPQAGPIQGVGGIKGSQVLDWIVVYSISQFALARTTAAMRITDEQRAAMERFNSLALNRSTLAALNSWDQILRDNLEDGLPAQYVVEEADCRLYWTAEMVTDITVQWKAVADAAFHGGKCAYGGLPAPSVKKKEKRERNTGGVVPRTVSKPRQHNTVRSSGSKTKRAELAAQPAMMRAKHLLKAIP